MRTLIGYEMNLGDFDDLSKQNMQPLRHKFVDGKDGKEGQWVPASTCIK
jgi:hypothetical protein